MVHDAASPVYQGQFGTFMIDEHDRRGVILYRSGLAIAAASFALGTILVLGQPLPTPTLNLEWASVCFWLMTAGLGLSLWTIHIYLAALHRLLQLFLAIGSLSAIYVDFSSPTPLVATVGGQPLTILGIGFTFAALTGIYFKEAFCFNRLETKVLTPLVPLLLLGYLASVLPITVAKIGLIVWAGLFLVFAGRKTYQPIPPDIGDKSVFTYLQSQYKTKT